MINLKIINIKLLRIYIFQIIKLKLNLKIIIGSEKLLKINIPNLNQNLEVKFDKESTLKKFSWEN